MKPEPPIAFVSVFIHRDSALSSQRTSEKNFGHFYIFMHSSTIFSIQIQLVFANVFS